MSLFVKKMEGHTWRQAAELHARPYGLEFEVLSHFDHLIEAGLSEEEACLYACEEWDVCCYGEDT